MLVITSKVHLPDDEVEIAYVCAQGAGGQNVNKVATAAHLRFDISASSLPAIYKEKLLLLRDRRISASGVVVIKAQRYRSQEKNRDDALARLTELIRSAMKTQKKRLATQPSRASQQKRMDVKSKRGEQKNMRRKVDW